MVLDIGSGCLDFTTWSLALQVSSCGVGLPDWQWRADLTLAAVSVCPRLSRFSASLTCKKAVLSSKSLARQSEMPLPFIFLSWEVQGFASGAESRDDRTVVLCRSWEPVASPLDAVLKKMIL